MLNAISNKRFSLVCTPTFESSWGRCPQNLRSADGYACGAVRWRSAKRLALANSRMVRAVEPTTKIAESQVGAAVPAPPLAAAPGLSCRRLASAGNETLGRLGCRPRTPRFPLRSACLADGLLPRATKRFAGGAAAPTVPLPAALVLFCRRRYRGQRNTCHSASALAHS
jgi:hypothetical protein